MSYDFAVFTWDSVASAAWAARRYELVCAGADGPVREALTAFVDDLNRHHGLQSEGTFLSSEPDVGALGVVLTCQWPQVHRARDTVLELTRSQDLAVYDPQLGRLYQPVGAVAVEVTMGGGDTCPYLSPGLLEDLLERPDPEEPFLVLARDEHVYMQTIRGENGEQILEHRAGGPDRHFISSTTELTIAREVLWDWVLQGGYWEDALEWQRTEL